MNGNHADRTPGYPAHALLRGIGMAWMGAMNSIRRFGRFRDAGQFIDRMGCSHGGFIVVTAWHWFRWHRPCSASSRSKDSTNGRCYHQRERLHVKHADKRRVIPATHARPQTVRPRPNRNGFGRAIFGLPQKLFGTTSGQPVGRMFQRPHPSLCEKLFSHLASSSSGVRRFPASSQTVHRIGVLSSSRAGQSSTPSPRRWR